MSRKIAREEAFKLLYQIDIHKGEENRIVEDFFSENKMGENDKAYISDVVYGTLENIEDINQLIENNLIGWTAKRISKVNMAILRLAVYEMLKREDIPISVSINEAIELAKTYDNESIGPFINGVLGSIQKQLSNKE